jgi:hypothetical protein
MYALPHIPHLVGYCPATRIGFKDNTRTSRSTCTPWKKRMWENKAAAHLITRTRCTQKANPNIFQFQVGVINTPCGRPWPLSFGCDWRASSAFASHSCILWHLLAELGWLFSSYSQWLLPPCRIDGLEDHWAALVIVAVTPWIFAMFWKSLKIWTFFKTLYKLINVTRVGLFSSRKNPHSKNYATCDNVLECLLCLLNIWWHSPWKSIFEFKSNSFEIIP